MNEESFEMMFQSLDENHEMPNAVPAVSNANHKNPPKDRAEIPLLGSVDESGQVGLTVETGKVAWDIEQGMPMPKPDAPFMDASRLETIKIVVFSLVGFLGAVSGVILGFHTNNASWGASYLMLALTLFAVFSWVQHDKTTKCEEAKNNESTASRQGSI